MKTKKRRKSTRMHGRGMGTHGRGSRKKAKKSGHHGGAGMAGTGKRADHKKTLINNLYGNDYFGKQGITSKGTKRDRRKRINIGDIERNMQSYVKRGLAKKTKDGFELNLEGYKILGEGEIKNKVTVKAMEASESAIKKIERVGGKILLASSSKIDRPKAGGEIIVKKISEKENKSEEN